VRDGLADHSGESYVGETAKSMNAEQLGGPRTDDWGKILITLKNPLCSSKLVTACLQQSTAVA
jgi:hypothetical protein